VNVVAPDLGLEIAGGTTSRDGLYVCGRCGQVASPSQREIDLAESRPAARVMLKCAHCHRQAVEWHPPAAARSRPQPVSPERGAVLFGELRQKLAQFF
jgi:DNA-directed RNA polymerase subunit RPC12/RpoP